MLGPRHTIARLQSDFYRDQYRKIMRWLVIAVFIMYALIAIIFYLIIFQPGTQYYANTSNGIILAMPPYTT